MKGFFFGVFAIVFLSPSIALSDQSAQSEISASDIARLRAFIGDMQPGHSVSGSGRELASGGGYRVRSGDTLSGIIDRQFSNLEINSALLKDVIVSLNPHAFKRGNPNWLLAGREIKFPSSDDFKRYIFPSNAKDHEVEPKYWVRYP